MLQVQGYNQFGGQHSESAALRNVLAHVGINNPHTGEPFSEAMLFGIAGGIGLAYFVFEFNHTITFFIGTRLTTPKQDFVRDAAERLGVQVEVKQTAGSKGAAKHLQEALSAGQPAIVFVDRANLPYQGYPADRIGHYMHNVVVYGLDEAEDVALIGDLAAAPMTATATELSAARARQTTQKNRLLTVSPDSVIDDLPAAIRAGIASCTEAMLHPEISNFGLKALVKWAGMISNRKDKKGWPQLLNDPGKLYDALKSVYFNIEVYDTPGGGYRGLYADFLQEAAAVLNQPDLNDVAAQYLDLASQWTTLAETALPDESAPLRQTRELLNRKADLYLQQGMDGVVELHQIEAQLAELRACIDDDSMAGANDIPARLREHIVQLREGETAAINALKHIVS